MTEATISVPTRPAGLLRLWGDTAWLRAASVAALLTTGLAAIQFASPDLAGIDGYYHIKLAHLMQTEGLTPEFTWLPQTILNSADFVDHHFLFHVALIPFTYGDLVVGAKWASVAFGSIALMALWWTLDRQRVPYATGWALAMLVVSEAFIYRLSMPRAQSLSLAILMFGLHWLLTGQHRRLLPLAFVYVWLYDAFPLLLLACGIYLAGRRLTAGAFDVRPLAYAALGTALGLVVHPYFPQNIIFAVQHILPKLTDATSLSVGNEWFPYTTGQLLENSGLALLVALSGVLALGLARERMQLRTAVAFGLVAVFGFMLFEARRFVEYFPAFGLVFAAFAWTPLLQRGEIRGRSRRLTPGWVLAGLLATPLLWRGGQASYASLQGIESAYRFRGAAIWLAEHTPSGARVFQTDWDDFPRLFFHNSHNTYLVGLDPSYMQLYDAALYDKWVELTYGDSEDLSADIQQLFGSDYVFTDLKHTDFLRAAAEDAELREVYRDDEAAVFVIDGN